MDSQITEPNGESREIETPEDVAVLYSWANLHGAKYRDFSASRREYRAQMRRQAAEAQREEELKAQAEAEAAAATAEAEAKAAAEAAQKAEQMASMDEKDRAVYELHEAQRRAKAERIEAERRAAAAAMAEDELLRAEREMADAHASAQRQAARYAESEQRRRQLAGPQPKISVPGEISDPYTAEHASAEVEHHIHHPTVSGSRRAVGEEADPIHPRSREMRAAAHESEVGNRRRPRSTPNSYAEHLAAQERRAEFERSDAARAEEENRLAHEEREARRMRAEAEARREAEAQQRRAKTTHEEWPSLQRQDWPPAERQDGPAGKKDNYDMTDRRDEQSRPRAPRGFHPDETTGERQAYSPRQQDPTPDLPTRQFIPIANAPVAPVARVPEPERNRPEQQPEPRREFREPAPQYREPVAPYRDQPQYKEQAPTLYREYPQYREPASPQYSQPQYKEPQPRREYRETVLPPAPPPAAPVQAVRPEPRLDYRRPGDSRYMGASSRSSIRLPDDLLERMGSVRPAGSELRPAALAPAQAPVPASPTQLGPAWLYPGQEEKEREQRPPERTGLHRSQQDYFRVEDRVRTAPSSAIDDTLQQSRERVAARWYALKGVFEGSPQEQAPEPQPVRQTELRTPMVAVFSLAGGVGRTSLVATLGRALSSLGEKVLLTDTSAHSLLPFYFGASELRPGLVRTFSPPSDSTDAPIACVSYDLDQRGGDPASQDWFAEEIARNSRGMQRVLLDLSGSAGWVARRLARMNPTVVVPVAPDMNSVISLQSVERFFAGVVDGNGRQMQPYFLLNQFDASLPLHLDVREVLRQQLGDRLLPFVVRRAPAVSEALAEGMTVVDYAPDAAVSGDYMNVATWLRSIAVPVTAGFRNLRWSER